MLKWERKEEFSLAIVNSVLHYFSREGQLKVLKNIARALQPKGYLLLKTFIQIPNNLELFTILNDIVGKKLQLLTINELKKLFIDAGFKKVDFLGDASTWNCSSESLKRRYKLSDIQIQEMRLLIEQAHPDKKVGFTQTKEEFTIPIYYKVFLLQK